MHYFKDYVCKSLFFINITGEILVIRKMIRLLRIIYN